MSRDFAVIYGNKKITKAEMRKFSQRPGLIGKDGKPQYTTEQHHKKECDINHIIRKYDKTGLITHISKFEAKFGNATQMDFKNAMDLITSSKQQFDELPAKIRNRFENNPEKLIAFMDDPENREEAIKLGLIRGDWTEESDGLGEHVEEGENVKKIDETETIE